MEKREIVSRTLREVKPNGSHSTGKPSTVTMAIEKRFSASAYSHYLDMSEGIEPGIGLKSFELVAVYEDGLPEPGKAPEEIVLDEIEETLDDALEDHCEHCGKVLNDGDNIVMTEDSVYLCESCAAELEKSEKTETDQQEIELTETEEAENGEEKG